MKKFQVIPLQSLVGVQLGWTKNETYEKIGKPNRSINSTDYYENPYFSIHYDQNNFVEYIEVSNLNSNQYKLILENIDIFNTEAIELIKKLKIKLGINYDESDPEIPYSFIFPDIELSFWRPIIPENEFDSEGKYFETVGIGIKGYYSS